MDRIPKVLTIGGSDPSGGAGIQADLKVMAQIGVYGTAAVTSLTRQTSLGVIDVLPLPPEWVIKQVEDVLWDLQPTVIKTGMLQNADNIRNLARLLRGYIRGGTPDSYEDHKHVRLTALVVDPVLNSGTGVSLLESSGLETLTSDLLPLATVVTPNVPEAEALTGLRIRDYADMERAAEVILNSGVRWVLLKGGHLPDQYGGEIADLLCNRERRLWLKKQRVPAVKLHGTGCTLASALASLLSLGLPVVEAAERATYWVHRRIVRPLYVGRGRGVVCQQYSQNYQF